jgi:hypothetical protein
MSGAFGTHGKRRVMYTELRGERDALENLWEGNIKMDLKEIALEE